MRVHPFLLASLAMTCLAKAETPKADPNAPKPPVAAAPAVPANPAIVPKDRNSEAWWKQRHENCVATSKKGGVDLAFFGDSITQGWEGAGRDFWKQTFEPLKAANYGFSGDRTEHMLWRLNNGEIDGITPKVVVLMLGTNNVGHKSSSPAQTAEGMKLILAKFQEKLPQTKILLLAVFPRDEKPDGAMRVAVNEINAAYKTMGDDKRVFFLDISDKLKQPDGTLTKEITPDFLHLSPKGYQIWTDAIKEKIAELMK